MGNYILVPVANPEEGFPAEVLDVLAPTPDELSLTAARSPPDGREEDGLEWDEELNALLSEGDAGWVPYSLAEHFGFPQEFAPGAPRRSSGSKMPSIDELAMYLPFHVFFPDSWGIYLTFEGVAHFCRALQDRAPHASPKDCLDAAHVLLYQHEAFHHHVESFSSRLEVVLRKRLYVEKFNEFYAKSAQDSDEEAVATAVALDKILRRPAWRRSGLAAAAESIVRDMGPGYARGADLTGKGLEPAKFKLMNDMVEYALDVAKKRPMLWDAFPHALSGLARRTSRVHYLVPLGSPIAARLNARFLRYRELARILEREGCFVKRQGKHEVWANAKGDTQPVPRHPGDLRRGTLESICRGLLGRTARDLGLR